MQHSARVTRGSWSRERNHLVYRSGLLEYDIAIAQLCTPAGVASWVEHLRDKNWATPAVLRDFLALVREVTSVEYATEARP